jgi:hypothetical protein
MANGDAVTEEKIWSEAGSPAARRDVRAGRALRAPRRREGAGAGGLAHAANVFAAMPPGLMLMLPFAKAISTSRRWCSWASGLVAGRDRARPSANTAKQPAVRRRPEPGRGRGRRRWRPAGADRARRAVSDGSSSRGAGAKASRLSAVDGGVGSGASSWRDRRTASANAR